MPRGGQREAIALQVVHLPSVLVVSEDGGVGGTLGSPQALQTCEMTPGPAAAAPEDEDDDDNDDEDNDDDGFRDAQSMS